MKLRNVVMTGLLLVAAACGNEETTAAPATPQPTPVGFAKGADVSWLTEMESVGKKFYSSAGQETECMKLLARLGFNSIRLRVWVNPANGWCNKNDVVAKAIRAHALGLRLMIDFHYSDNWADPGKQYKPQQWKALSLADLKTALAQHTKEVLNALKQEGISPEWVQVGNENGPGMLWDTNAALSGATYDVKQGDVTYPKNEANFAAFIATGCNAVKEVFPDAKVMVHVQEGNDNNLFRWIFDMLNTHKAPYDVIGMSLYPEKGNWQSLTADCIANVRDMISRYGKEVMICEVGMAWDEAAACKSFLTELMKQAKSIDKCLGVFYWEPQSYGAWSGYTKGAFDNQGRPTIALDAFN